jgi:hypothetical protein
LVYYRRKIFGGKGGGCERGGRGWGIKNSCLWSVIGEPVYLPKKIVQRENLIAIRVSSIGIIEDVWVSDQYAGKLDPAQIVGMKLEDILVPWEVLPAIETIGHALRNITSKRIEITIKLPVRNRHRIARIIPLSKTEILAYVYKLPDTT